MMVAALDHVDCVDLHIAKMFDGRLQRLRPGPEWSMLIELLSAQPETPRLDIR